MKNNLKNRKAKQPCKDSGAIKPLSAKQTGKGAEEALQESEERFRLAFENANIGMCLVDLQGRLTKVNLQMSEIFGYSQEELEDMTVNDNAHPEDLNISPSFIQRATSGEIEYAHFEKRYFHKDGHIVYGQVSSSLVRNPQGKPQYFISHVQDISERKRAEEAMLVANERLQYLLSSTSAVIYTSKISGDYGATFISNNVIQMTGYEPQEFLKNSSFWIDHIHPEDKKRILAELPSVFEKGYHIYEYRFLNKDNTYRWMRDEMKLARDQDGNPIEIIGFWIDITDRKQAEEALKENQGKFRFLAEKMADIVWTMDLNFHTTYVSPSIEKVLGFTPEERGRQSLEKMIAPSSLDKVQGIFLKELQREENGVSDPDGSLVIELEYYRKDGSIVWMETTVKAMRDAAGALIGIYGVSRDITERKQTEEELRKSEEAAKRIARENTIIAEIGRIISSSLNIDEVYERFTEEVRKLIPFDRIMINIIDPDKKTVSFAYISGINIPSRQIGDVVPLAGTATEEVMRTRSSLLVQTENIVEVARCFPGLLPSFQAGLRSIIFVPLISKDQIIGTLSLRSTKPNAYTNQELKLSGNIGTQIAGAIANAQLFRERKQAEEKYKTILRTTMDGFWIVDMQGHFLDVNDAYCQMVGFSRDELLTMSISDVEVVEKPEETARRIQKIMEVGGDRFETLHKCKDGRVIDIEVSVNYMEAGGGVMFVFLRDITDRKRAEEALRTEKQRFQTLSENAPFGMVMIDKDGTFKYINPIFRELFGYDLTDVPNGKTWFRKAYPDPIYRHHVIAEWMKDLESFKRGEKRPRIFKATCKDGTEKIVNFISVLLETGEYLMTCEDITERKQAEESLKESEEKYRLLVEESLQGIVVAQGNPPRPVFVNPAMTMILGYTFEEFLSLSPQEIEGLVHPEDRAFFFKNYKDRLEGKSVLPHYEFRGIRKDGTVVWLELSSARIEYKGQPSVQAAFLDITERKRAEEALRQSEERYRTILENIEDGYYEVDIAGNVTFCNDSFGRLFGYSKDEMMGMNNRQYTDEENAQKLYQAFNKVYRTREPTKTFDLAVIRKDGTKLFGEVSVSLMMDAKGEPIGFRGIARDITERKRAEEEIKRTLSLLNATLESTADGILVVDRKGKIESFNQNFVQMWHIPESIIASRNDDQALAFVLDQLKDPESFLTKVRELYDQANAESFDLLEFKDGRVFERFSKPQRVVEQSVGRVWSFRDVTERKKAEESLVTEKQRFQTLSDQAPFGMVMVDENGTFKYINPKFRELFGYDLTDIPDGRTWFRKAYPDPTYRHRVIEAWINDLKSPKAGEKRSRIFTVTCKDGTEKTINFILVQLATGENLMACEDITERTHSEYALKESEERYRMAIESSNDGVAIVLKDRHIYVNKQFVKMFGYESIEEVLGQSPYAWIHPDDRERVMEFNRKRQRGEKVPMRYETKGVRKDGGVIYLEISAARILLHGEYVTLAYLRDITDRKQAEEALRESQQLLKKTFLSLHDAVFIIDAETTRIMDCNPAASEMFGYAREEMVGQTTLFLHVNNEALQEFRTHMYAGVEEKGFLSLPEFRMRRKNGELFSTEHSVVPLEDDQGERIGWVSVVRDITERKRAEEEMRALEERFRQSQKMEAVGRLAGGIAHDFNNLLTIIKGYSQLSLLDLKESDPLWGNIQEIQKATQRATDLTRQLLAFSRRQILDLKVLDMNTLLRDLDKMLRRIIGEDIELVTVLEKDLGRVKIDPGQFEQIILNLSVNARDAMPSGGKLIIETANVELDEGYVRTHISVIPGQYVRLSVSDTGFGMSREVSEKVFEPFFTTKEKGKGTGLGMSTVYGIVKQSGGNIWVYSESGHGTTFKIYLPKVEEKLDTLHLRDETDSLPRGTETVLLVEDEASVRDLAHRILSQQGYKVLEAANGEEALRVTQKHPGEKIHLLLTDVVMPQMGGKELTGRLKNLRPDIKVLYTSGYTDNAIVHHGVLDPGTHFLQKPFSPKTLSHKVREVLDRS